MAQKEQDKVATDRIRIAVVGGGCAAMAAAFELSRPHHQGRYEVTVYQQGWRLGGKGASGRGPSGRIEEHGLHLWMGWYENAFRLMRQCYEELARDPELCRIATWRDAFKRDSFTGAMEQDRHGVWRCWRAALPEAPGEPGDPYLEPPRWSVSDYMVRAAALLQTLLTTLTTGLDRNESTTLGFTNPLTSDAARLDGIGAVIRLGQLGTLAGLLEGVELLGTLLGGMSPESGQLIIPFLDAVSSSIRAQLDAIVAGDDQSRRLWTIMDLTLATMRGILRHNLMTHPRGFEVIDDYDCREWLLLNGASRQSVDSGYLRALYDLGFAYEDGDPHRPRLAAGQALRSMLRAFFTYRGAFFWKMQSGMGDVVFAPLYEVLRRRGVRFEFFHRLENVRLSAGNDPYVDALEFDVQARTASGGQYEPLIDVDGLPCWPNQPLWAQLQDGTRFADEGRDFESFFEARFEERRTVRVEEDFDLVVLGVGLGAIPHVCREIVARDPRWRAMVDHVKTVSTQALQLWLKADMKELGWHDRPVNVSGFVEPFDTWADMSHLVREECWDESPRAIAYFCSVLPDVEAIPPRERRDWIEVAKRRVRQHAVDFLERDLRHLWPNVQNAEGGFRWDLLADPYGRQTSRTPVGDEQIDTQFWLASVNPTDRYTLSLPGSLMYRISPLDRTYDNLTIAGDWTNAGFNAGCVEAAVMSGMLAAHAISRFPALGDIVGYDHP
jgi:uncharacterized protein with NAD-binding domain and iron-sulfur cluster